MVPLSRGLFPTLLSLALAGTVATLSRCAPELTRPPNPSDGIPDPTLLPLATGQEPNVSAYVSLNVANRAAGFSYDDPVTGVKVWKVTSATVPANNTGAGHDYAEGGAQVSRGWGPTQPGRDLCASFSNVAGQEQILYILHSGQLVRYNTGTMALENTGHFPRTLTFYAWLHQDKNDVWFTGMASDNKTVWAWNSQTDQFLTHLETWTNEPHLERDGRYLVLTSGGPYTTTRVWDLPNDTLGPVQDATVQFHVSHGASARGHFIMTDVNASAPQTQVRFDFVSGPEMTRSVIFQNSLPSSRTTCSGSGRTCPVRTDLDCRGTTSWRGNTASDCRRAMAATNGSWRTITASRR